jgi:hypothetical protein
MKAITEAIDAWTNSQYSGITRKLFGYSELMRKTSTGSEQPMPVTIPTREQVSLNDRYDLITWIRLPGQINSGDEIDGNDWSFGLSVAPVQTATLRFIVAHKVLLGEDFIIGFINAIPSLLTVSGFQIVSVDRPGIAVDADHEAIYTTELGNTVYEKHRFTWNIYALTLNIEYLPNEDC